MSKIYEALEHARRELQEVRQPVTDVPVEVRPEARAEKSAEPEAEKPSAVPSVPVTQGLDLEREMASLYQSINSLLPEVSHRVIQFVSARQGEGTSTIIHELARIATTLMGRSVLLLDIDQTHVERPRFSECASPPHIDEVVDEAICRVENTMLFVSPLFQHSVLTPQKLGSDSTDQLWDQLRERFDYILIDSPPISVSSDGLAIVRKADGVIFVVEAEKTRWTVAQAAKEKIVSHGGNILGMVFNKRRFYIPEVVYRKI
jgi:protein-tyrosine kinase